MAAIGICNWEIFQSTGFGPILDKTTASNATSSVVTGTYVNYGTK
jgi:hypothetical protein